MRGEGEVAGLLFIALLFLFVCGVGPFPLADGFCFLLLVLVNVIPDITLMSSSHFLVFISWSRISSRIYMIHRQTSYLLMLSLA